MQILSDLLLSIFYSTYYEEQSVIDPVTEKPISTTVNLFRVNRLTGAIHYVRSWTKSTLNVQPNQKIVSAYEASDKIIISATLEDM
ncbi:MAG: hypothetical protein KME33_21655 [Aetokthonos hydrillicola CCALA 1050]|jgi:hypothetical protein|nr:hypothetical protein [Aetokthonos hydrillicola CCALA 1050]